MSDDLRGITNKLKEGSLASAVFTEIIRDLHISNEIHLKSYIKNVFEGKGKKRYGYIEIILRWYRGSLSDQDFNNVFEGDQFIQWSERDQAD